ncbi:hypothetical protein [Candidatus Magnetomonas plexicatena]|uniref:hypothetical protein n=1 Tax=Candidatus Magnetomonas plexicatena TaxID=2552947 RepID=UPI001C761086|nr:hypothetical protein E2O03_004400 [Nitrospirales bacterium LBB_01]
MNFNMWEVFKIFLRKLLFWRKQPHTKKLFSDIEILCKIFPPKLIKIRKDKITVISDSGSDMSVEVSDDKINVYGGISLKNCVVFLKNHVLVVKKVGKKILNDGSLWVDNTLFIGNIEELSSLNIVSGGIVHSNIDTLSMLYVKDGRFKGDIGKVEKWLHISDPVGFITGNVHTIMEAMYLDSGALITESLPAVIGGYVVIKECKVQRPDGQLWSWEEILGKIGDLNEDQEVFLFGSGGNILLGAGAKHILFREGTDTYSRYKTETIISSNNFFRLINGKAQKVSLKIANNQHIEVPQGRFYSLIRFEICDET